MHDEQPICIVCGRPIPPEAPQSLHHLVPRVRGGTDGATVQLHQICHNEIHAALTGTELARGYATPEALRSHPRPVRFVRWLRDKPPTFHARSDKRGRR